VVDGHRDLDALAFSFSRYSSNRSAGTSKAMWFMVPIADIPSGPCRDVPGSPSGAFANQKNAMPSTPLPMSRKKC